MKLSNSKYVIILFSIGVLVSLTYTQTSFSDADEISITGENNPFAGNNTISNAPVSTDTIAGEIGSIPLECGDTGNNNYCPVKVSTDKSVYDKGEFILIKGTVDEKISNEVQIGIIGGGVSASTNSQIDSKNQFIRAYIPTNLHNQNSNYTLTVTYGTLKGITNFTVLN